MKVALVIGHSMTSGGATSYNHVSEFEYNEELAGMIGSNLYESDTEVVIMHRKKYKDLPFEINRVNPDLIISLHCNAHNTKATGTETLYYYSSVKGKALATKLQNAMHECLGLVNRGIKPKHSEDRGGYLLKYTNAPCVIVEPFFIDNPLDFSVGMDLKEDLALAISDTVNNK